MPKLRLVYSKTGRYVTAPQKKSTPSSIVLPTSALIFWKIERLQAQRPGAVDVIERLVDNLLAELDRGER